MIRTFIYGSCVSRDTFEYVDKERFSLLRYVARSSLISAFSPPAPLPIPTDHGLSAFQLRQVCTDSSSRLLPTLRELADRIDLLLWDLVDERLGVYTDAEGHVVTDSIELRTVGDHVLLDAYQHIPFGTDEHLALFRAALEPWRQFLEGQDLLDRLVVVAVPWASTDLDGRPAPASFGVTGSEGNRLFEPYYAAVREAIGVPLIGSAFQVHTHEGHKWGPAPFHYIDSDYEEVAKRIEDWAWRH